MEKIYTTPYGEIHYWVNRVQDRQQWLVFLPGLTADHHLFDKQMEYFREKYNCLTWDAPAHGCSRVFELKFSMKDMACYLNDIFTVENIERPVLIGQSLGGYISQFYIDEYPGSVAGFLSIDSCPLKGKYYTRWELAMMKHTKWMYRSIPWKTLIRWGANGTARTEYGRMLMKQMMESYEKREYCQLAGYGYKILAEAVEAEREYKIDCPALLLCGERDMAGSAKRYNRRWEQEEGHRLIWIPEAGHNSNTDSPEIINCCIEAFCEQEIEWME